MTLNNKSHADATHYNYLKTQGMKKFMQSLKCMNPFDASKLQLENNHLHLSWFPCGSEAHWGEHAVCDMS